jgi:hypothetical protein
MYLGPGIYCIRNGLHDIVLKNSNVVHKIGFNNPIVARKVLYHMDPYKDITYLPGVSKVSGCFVMDINARIIIPKIKREIFDSSMDSYLHLIRYTETEYFYNLAQKQGIVMPRKIIAENEHGFIFNVLTMHSL